MAVVKKAKIDYNLSFDKEISNKYEEVKLNWCKSVLPSDPKVIVENKLEIIQYPFPVCLLHNFTNPLLLNDIILDESFLDQFHPKSNDLYEFTQTTDLLNLEKTSAVEGLYNLIKKDLRKWVEHTLAKGPLKEEISATFSCYKKKDRLLCHDDKCDDRHIAWVLYLTEIWSKGDGGSLDLFDTDSAENPNKIVHSISPTFNTMVLFEVTDTSYHQVSEILSSSKKRYSLNGWFHLKNNIINDSPPKVLNLTYDNAVDIPVDLENLILVNYLQLRNQLDIRKMFVDNSEIQLDDFFLHNVWKTLSEEIISDTIKWKFVGPPNVRRYEIADEDSLPTASLLTTLISALKSETWLKFLKSITGLDLAPSINSDLSTWQQGVLPRCHIELQRCQSGNYTLAHDFDSEFHSAALDVILRLPWAFIDLSETDDDNNDDDLPIGGHIVYVDKTSDDDECLLHLGYKYNSLGLVYRDSSTIRFLKYLNKSSVPFYQIQCSYRTWEAPQNKPDLKHNPDESNSDPSELGEGEDIGEGEEGDYEVNSDEDNEDEDCKSESR